MTLSNETIKKCIDDIVNEAYGHQDLQYDFEKDAGFDSNNMSWGFIEKCRERYGEPIGKGLDRIVFQIDDYRIIKVAYGNGMSVKQNIAECKFYEYYKGIRNHLSITPTIYDYAKDYQWIVMEYVLPFTIEDLKHFGVPFAVFKDGIRYLLIESGEHTYDELQNKRKNAEIGGYHDDNGDPVESSMRRYKSAYDVCCSKIRNFRPIFAILSRPNKFKINISELFRIVENGDSRNLPNLGLGYDLNGEGRLVLLDTGLYGWENGQCQLQYNEQCDTMENKDEINEVESSDINLNSFKVKNELHPKFWINNKLNSRVRVRLLDIADDFLDELSMDWIKPKDIVLTGSIANFNWSRYSDVDIHIMMDYSKIYKNTDFVKDYFDSKKEIWSDTHENLRIYGFPVEVYVEDCNQTNYSTGIYSLTKNKWIKQPSDFQDAKLNEKHIKTYSAKVMTDIDNTIKKLKKAKDEKKIVKLSNELRKIFNKLKNLRSEGLKNGGEMSSGNIIWKIMRRTGYTDKLWDLIYKSYDKVNSLK